MSAKTYMQQYRRATVEASGPEETLILLINEAVRSAESSRLEQDPDKRRQLLDKSRRIIAELSSTLNMDYGGEIAFNLLRLYIFINRRLADAMGGDPGGLTDALRILRHVQETWHRAVEIAREQGTEQP
jgi:flagellar protein FliS